MWLQPSGRSLHTVVLRHQPTKWTSACHRCRCWKKYYEESSHYFWMSKCNEQNTLLMNRHVKLPTIFYKLIMFWGNSTVILKAVLLQFDKIKKLNNLKLWNKSKNNIIRNSWFWVLTISKFKHKSKVLFDLLAIIMRNGIWKIGNITYKPNNNINRYHLFTVYWLHTHFLLKLADKRIFLFFQLII